MEAIISHLEAAKGLVANGQSTLGATGSQGPDPRLGPNSDLPHYRPDIPYAPELNFGPNTDLPHYVPNPSSTDVGSGVSDDLGPSSSSGFDNVYQEDVITEFGDGGDDDPLVDSVEVYEYDLGEWSDSVHSVDLSGIPGDAELNLLGYDANGAAIVSIGEDGIILTLEGEAAAYLVQGNYEWRS